MDNADQKMKGADVDIAKYWDREWSRRIVEDGVLMNRGKFEYLVKQLWKRPYLIPLRKLEVGCGTGLHIRSLSAMCKEWGENYVGVDLAGSAVQNAADDGVDAYQIDFLTMGATEKFQLFLFLDVLEHMPGHEAIAAKIRELADPNGFHIFGNVPLYRSKHEEEGGFERDMDIHVLTKFMKACGIDKFDHHVYGIDGFPYMIFEGSMKDPRKNEEDKTEKITGRTWAPTPGGGFKAALQHKDGKLQGRANLPQPVKPLRVLIRTPWDNSWVPLYRNVFNDRGHFSQKVSFAGEETIEPVDVVLHMWANDPGSLDYYPDAKQLVFMRRYEFFEGNWLKYQWDRVSHLIFCNDWIKDQTERIAKEKGITLPPTHLVYNAVDLDQWTFKERGPGNKIGMACHIHPKKNLPLAVQILAALPREYELHIAGAIQDDATAAYLQHIGQALGLKIKLYGHVPHNQMDQWWEDKSYCLSTSISEGNPNNVIEAMAKGIMPVVHDWPGAAEQLGRLGVYSSTSEAAGLINGGHYNSEPYREWVGGYFSLDNFRRVVRLCEEVCG